jgi:hypothetical protein
VRKGRREEERESRTRERERKGWRGEERKRDDRVCM